MRALLRSLYGPAVVTETIPAPPERIYAVLAEPETYPEWLVGADRIHGVDRQFPAPGTEFRHSVGPGGRATIDDTTESVAAEPGRRLVLRVHAGLLHARVEFELDRREGGVTEVTFREKPIGAMAVLTPILKPTLQARNRRSLQCLREFVAQTLAA